MTKQNVRVPDAAGSLGGVSTVVIPNRALFTSGTVNSPSRCIPVNRRNLKMMTKKLETAQNINAWVDSMRASSPTGHVRAATTTTRTNPQIQQQQQQQQQQQNIKTSWMINHPSALEKFEKIINESKGKKIVMFLDYDGTLSPIVDDPDRAFMSDEMRGAVRDVAKHFPTAIVTGRCKDKVYEFVKLAELYYAGSHGMDIQGPLEGRLEQDTVLFQPAGEFIPMIDEVYKILCNKTRSTPGAIVENNKFCLSVHFRRVDENRWDELADQVGDVLKNYPNLKLTQGRKVIEIRPTIKWDKGKALEFLLDSLGYSQSNDVFPIYIGDDRTDEDAFKVLLQRNQGFGILVSTVPKETNASYTLQEPSQVKTFLQRLVEWQSKRMH